MNACHHDAGRPGKDATPADATSINQSRSPSMPDDIANARFAAVFSRARVRRATASGDESSSRAARRVVHSSTQSGGNASGMSSSCRLTACLQGNFREGHVHFAVPAARSTHTRYGAAPEPLYTPHSTGSDLPRPCQRIGTARVLTTQTVARTPDKNQAGPRRAQVHAYPGSSQASAASPSSSGRNVSTMTAVSSK